MAILGFVKKVCVQTAVYWGNPQIDGYNKTTFDDPIEIKCRWEDKVRMIKSQNGEELTVKAEVLVTEQLELKGYLFLGNLYDLVGNYDLSDPMNIQDTYEIMATDKIPLFRSTTKFVNTVYLGINKG